MNPFVWWKNCYQLITQPVHELCAKKALTLQSINCLLCVHPDDILHHSEFYDNYHSQAGWRHLKKNPKNKTSHFIKKIKIQPDKIRHLDCFSVLHLSAKTVHGSHQRWRAAATCSWCYWHLTAVGPLFRSTGPVSRKKFLRVSRSASWMAPWQTAWCRGEIFQLFF